MLSRLRGTIIKFCENSAIIDVSGMGFEVLLPRPVMEELKNKPPEEEVNIVTYFYLQAGPSRVVPVIIGFNSEMEREFFEEFITVSSIGPKSAVKSLIYPFSQIAKAIDTGDGSLLKTMPGVGPRKVKEIIAKLQGKMARFFTLEAEKVSSDEGRLSVFIPEDIREETLEVLLQLQYIKKDALKKIEKALLRKPDVKTSQELLNLIWKEGF